MTVLSVNELSEGGLPMKTDEMKLMFGNNSIASLPSTAAPGVMSMYLEEQLEVTREDRSDTSSSSSSDSGHDDMDECCDDLQKGSPMSMLTAENLERLNDFISSDHALSTDGGDWTSRAEHLSDMEDDEFSMSCSQLPLLAVEEVHRPGKELPTCPPKSWLMKLAGFEVTQGPAFPNVPRRAPPGEAPTRYLDLFSRQLLARERTGTLTRALLEEHDKRLGVVRHTDPMPGMITELMPTSEWLLNFLAQARATPLYEVAATLVGSDLCEDLAAFLDTLSDVSSAPVAIDERDVPDGRHVTGRGMLVRPVHQGSGRCGFEIRDDVSISAPGGSQSPPPHRAAVSGHMDLPRPPVVR